MIDTSLLLALLILPKKDQRQSLLMTLSAHMVKIFSFPSDPILTIFHAMTFSEKVFRFG